MITRYKIQKTITLYEKRLNLNQAESQAAEIFAKWLKEHPKYSPDDVDMHIDSYGEEEDYMGHFGHISKYIRIFQQHEETDSEYDARIAEEESEILDEFRNELRNNIEDLIHDFNIYPNIESDEVDAHVNDIENAVMDIVKEKINNSNKKE